MIDVVVLTSDACHLCDDALEGLAELALEYPLAIRSLDMDSEEGHALVARHRPPMPPALLIDGELFSFGRLPRKKLRRRLERAA
ncbi:MAG TPA: glutaredoxin family protein [Actinomycetota bacterium]|nr:glutaredoxin family protein [Actinomycetota bacterium]